MLKTISNSHVLQVIAETRNTVNETKNATRHAEINAVDVVESLGRRQCSGSVGEVSFWDSGSVVFFTDPDPPASNKQNIMKNLYFCSFVTLNDLLALKADVYIMYLQK